MKCADVREHYKLFWQMNEDDPIRIEVEAHLLECEFCATELCIDLDEIEYLHESIQDPVITSYDIDYVNRQVMDRIYAEEAWYIPVASKRYHFSKKFRRNIALIVASCMAMCTLAVFLFIIDYTKENSQIANNTVSGLIDITNAATLDGAVHTAKYMTEIPVASISEPIVMQVVPLFPQYYVVFSILGFVLTLLLMNWFTRARN